LFSSSIARIYATGRAERTPFPDTFFHIAGAQVSIRHIFAKRLMAREVFGIMRKAAFCTAID
jgi:hypothetical protein